MTENLAVRIIKENFNNFEVLNKAEKIMALDYYGQSITYAIREGVAEINVLVRDLDAKNLQIKKGYKYFIPENHIKP